MIIHLPVLFFEFPFSLVTKDYIIKLVVVTLAFSEFRPMLSLSLSRQLISNPATGKANVASPAYFKFFLIM
jgi:hypothetical protein